MSIPSPSPASQPEIVPRPWQTGLGPYYIGLFLWIVYFDQIGLRALPVGGLMWSVLGAVVAGPLCYLLLFRVPAAWGQATRKPLPDLATSTFGEAGARWVPGLLLGLAEIAWFSVSVSYATDLTLRGLAEVRFLDERAFRPVLLGSLRLKGPIFLATALLWSVIAGLIGRKFVRLVAAIMYVFPVFPAVLLGGTMFAMLGGLRTFAPTGIDPMGLNIPEARAGVWSMMLVVQLILGFTAMAAVMGADWGAATTSARDVRVGGWVAVGFAPVVIATIALVAVAGFQGRVNPAPIAIEDPQNPLDVRRRSCPIVDQRDPHGRRAARGDLPRHPDGRHRRQGRLRDADDLRGDGPGPRRLRGLRLRPAVERVPSRPVSVPMDARGHRPLVPPDRGRPVRPARACLHGHGRPVRADRRVHVGRVRAAQGPLAGAEARRQSARGSPGGSGGSPWGFCRSPEDGSARSSRRRSGRSSRPSRSMPRWRRSSASRPRSSKPLAADDQGFGPSESISLPTAPTTSSSTDSAQGEGSP